MKASIALVAVAFGTLAFGWVTGRDLVLYVSIVCSALAGIALLKSTLSERKRRGAQTDAQAPPTPVPAPGKGRDKRGTGRLGFLRRKSSKVQEHDLYEPLPTVRTVRDPAEIARAQMADQYGYAEGSGGSVIDFRTRLAAALDTSDSEDFEEAHQQSGDLWADLEPHDIDPFALGDPERPQLVEPDADDLSDLVGRTPESLESQTGPIDIFSFEDEQESLSDDDGEDLEAPAEDAGSEPDADIEEPAAEVTLPAQGDEDEDEDDEAVVTDWIRIDDLPRISEASRGRSTTGRSARASSGSSSRAPSAKPAGSRSRPAPKAATARKTGARKSPSVTKVTTPKKTTRATASGRPAAAKAPPGQRGPRAASRGPAKAGAGGESSTTLGADSPEDATAPRTDKPKT